MKILELIAEHEGNDLNGRMFAEHLGQAPLAETERNAVIKYLEAGRLIGGHMEWWYDCENEEQSIGAAAYYTDGRWIWAAYHPYYLQKYPNFTINEEFLFEIQNRKFEMPEVSEEQIKQAEDYFGTHIFNAVGDETSE